MPRAMWITAPVLLCLCALGPAYAQDAREIQQLMLEAHDQMVSAGRLVTQATETKNGTLATRKRTEAAALFSKATGAYTKVLAALPGLKGVAKEAIVETQRIALYNLACAEAGQGRADQAIDAFGKALAAGYDDFSRIEKDPDLDPIRANPRFEQLLERVRAEILEQAREEAGPQLSKGALFPFSFKVKTLDGEVVELSKLKGKLVIVDYWGTWCPPCRREIPHFVKLKEEFGDKLVIVGMTWENGASDARAIAKVKRFAEKFKIGYRLTLLKKQAEYQDKVPDFEGFPTTLFIDKQGRVRAKEVGYRDFSTLHELLHALDDEDTPPEKRTRSGPF
jgi:thiol-disulfide isomerase/thioredoxin